MDALSCQDADQGILLAITGAQFHILDDLRRKTDTDADLVALKEKIGRGEMDEQWAVTDGLITYNCKVFIQPSSPSLPAIIATVYDAHEGVKNKLHRVRCDFHMKAMHWAVEDFVRVCTMCQRNKTTNLHPTGLLQPLPIPTHVWEDIAMDFVEGLPRVNDKTYILTVVNRFSKYTHFIPLTHPCTTMTMAHAFFTEIVRLHGLPATIVSDRDPIFTTSFGRSYFTFSM